MTSLFPTDQTEETQTVKDSRFLTRNIGLAFINTVNLSLYAQNIQQLAVYKVKGKFRPRTGHEGPNWD